MIHYLEPFRAGVRQGDWKLIRRTPMPQAVELYNIILDPSEKDNVHPPSARPGENYEFDNDNFDNAAHCHAAHA